MHIPQKNISTKAISHPWLDDKRLTAFVEKALAAGRAEFNDKTIKCNKMLRDAFVCYMARLRERITALPQHLKNLVTTQQTIIKSTHEIINNTAI